MHEANIRGGEKIVHVILHTKRIYMQYTENMPLGRLYNMCNSFFHERQVTPPANGFQLVCYTATLLTTET